MRETRELAFVNILVAILALCLRDFENRGFALRYVALVAGNRHMAAFQRVFCGFVIFHGEGRRLEAIHGVAACAVGAAGPFEELSSVIILMTIHARRKGYLRLEVPVLVAVFASHGFVSAEQWIFRFRMVESLQPCDLFPVRGVMTGLAALDKGALMQIDVTCRALRERKSRVLDERLRIRHRRMALRTGNLFVRPGQGIFRRRMIEEWCGFPAISGVATRTIFADLSAMLVGVAAHAVRRKGEEGFAEISVFDQRAVVALNIFRRMALSARDTCVFAFERVAGQLVVELLLRWFPVNQRKIETVVFEVAARAIFAVGIFHGEARVISAICSEMLRNLFVALETLERGSAGAELVAARTLRRAR